MAMFMLSLVLLLLFVLCTFFATRDVPPRASFVEETGQRKYMEDRHVMIDSFAGGYSFYGVFDGHGGTECSEFAKENLPKQIELVLQSKTQEDSIEDALTKAFLETDELFRAQEERAHDERKGVVGSTAVVALWHRKNRLLYVANIGDSRAVLVSRNGFVKQLSFDHIPDDPAERKRIEDIGGTVGRIDERGPMRIFGQVASRSRWDIFNNLITGEPRKVYSLSVSRSLGDTALKKFIISEPYVVEENRVEAGSVLIVASDGLWDKVTNEEAGKVVSESRKDPHEITLALTAKAKDAKIRDNLTCIVVILQ